MKDQSTEGTAEKGTDKIAEDAARTLRSATKEITPRNLPRVAREERPRVAIRLTDGQRLLVRHIVSYRPGPQNDILSVLTNGQEAREVFSLADSVRPNWERDRGLAELDRLFATV